MERCTNPICGGNGNCATCPKRISEKQNSDAFEAVAEYTVFEKVDAVSCRAQNTENEYENKYAVAIDLGSTTLVFALIDIESGKLLNTTTMLNSQRKYGLDVLSRIQSSVDGKKDELRECIQKDLCEGIDRLLKEYNVGINTVLTSQIEHIVISGNTTMTHLLMGYDCDTLGVYPFMPVNTDIILGNTEDILGYKQQKNEIKTSIMPGISAFVGGDIVSGLYARDFAEKEEISLFVDLGTNGEIALGNCDKILTTSVAAGPAFEGGNISCGTGSVAGAICAVEISDDASYVQFKTIHDAPPCGICGTGVIETVAELLKCGFVDETGLLAEEYFESGFVLANADNTAKSEYTEQIARAHEYKPIVFTQKDIREFQLAKAAVRTGIEILTVRYGITTDKIDKVYIAGGFGYHLNVRKAASIGLIPQELADKTTAVGNTSLAGTVKYITDRIGAEKLQKIKEISETIILANDTDFQEQYLKNTCLG